MYLTNKNKPIINIPISIDAEAEVEAEETCIATRHELQFWFRELLN